MNFLEYNDEFIGLYISLKPNEKLGHDITINANPVITIYPKSYNIEWIEMEVYL